MKKTLNYLFIPSKGCFPKCSKNTSPFPNGEICNDKLSPSCTHKMSFNSVHGTQIACCAGCCWRCMFQCSVDEACAGCELECSGGKACRIRMPSAGIIGWLSCSFLRSSTSLLTKNISKSNKGESVGVANRNCSLAGYGMILLGVNPLCVSKRGISYRVMTAGIWSQGNASAHLPQDLWWDLNLKRSLCGGLIVAFQYLKESYKEAGKGLFIQELKWQDKRAALGHGTAWE